MAELSDHLAHPGVPRRGRYAARTLNRLTRQGRVARFRRAVYRIDCSHPKLARVREAQGGACCTAGRGAAGRSAG